MKKTTTTETPNIDINRHSFILSKTTVYYKQICLCFPATGLQLSNTLPVTAIKSADSRNQTVSMILKRTLVQVLKKEKSDTVYISVYIPLTYIYIYK